MLPSCLKWFDYFLGNIWKDWSNFFSIIWSHWLRCLWRGQCFYAIADAKNAKGEVSKVDFSVKRIGLKKFSLTFDQYPQPVWPVWDILKGLGNKISYKSIPNIWPLWQILVVGNGQMCGAHIYPSGRTVCSLPLFDLNFFTSFLVRKNAQI